MSNAFHAGRTLDFKIARPVSDTRPLVSGLSDVSKAIVVERADTARLASIEPAWRDLVGRALEPNVFMDPGILLAAVASEPKRRIVILLAWDSSRSDARLVGVWAGAIERALLPLRVLQVPAGPHGFVATPVLDRYLADSVLHAMFDAIAAAPDLPNILSAMPMREDGPTMPVLRRVLQARNAGSRIFAQWRRAMLQSDKDGDAYLAVSMGSSSRKKLRQHRRRLAGRGALELRTYLSASEVCAAFEQFLAMEAAGWKGRRGDALNCSPSDVAFSRKMIATLAARGDARIYALCFDEKPISMQIMLCCGGAAFAWKTAYDEAQEDASPGMLLFEDYTKALLADPTIAFADSCTFDEQSFMSAWGERETFVRLWIDVCRGGSRTFVTAARAQAGLLWLRGHVKRVYKAALRTWQKVKR